MGTLWAANGVACFLPKSQRDGVMVFITELKKKLRPERAHIVPDDFD